jgi:hypothetical protein
MDDWTETTTDWTGFGTITADSDSKVGSYCIKDTISGSVCQMRRSNIGTITAAGWKRKDNDTITFWLKYNFTSGNFFDIVIELWAPDITNRFIFHLKTAAPAFNTYYEIALNTGPSQETTMPSLPNTVGWCKAGNPSWDNIQSINFILTPITLADMTLQVDGLHFKTAMFSGTASDSISIAKYGIQWAEPQTDSELQSDAECELKAKSLIDFLKATIESLDVTVDGDNNFVPGDKQRVIVTNDNLDAYFRIMEIRHVIDGVSWDTILKLSNEPKLMDYIFASANAPRYAGATIIVPRDFSSIQQGINALVIT